MRWTQFETLIKGGVQMADPAFALAPKRAAWLRSKLIKVRPKDDVAILTMHVVL